MNPNNESVQIYQRKRATILQQLHGFQLDELCDQIRRRHDRLDCLDQLLNRFRPEAYEKTSNLTLGRFLKRLATSIIRRMNVTSDSVRRRSE